VGAAPLQREQLAALWMSRKHEVTARVM